MKQFPLFVWLRPLLAALFFAVVMPSDAQDAAATRTFTVKGVTFTMVFVEGGTFTMGATPEQWSEADDDEKPAHQVTLSSFFIGQTEVTQELWQAVMDENPSFFSGNRRPVEQVSWIECQKFVQLLNEETGLQFRLPTEAEWEYAARGGNKSKGYKYSGDKKLGRVAWEKSNSRASTHDVATKAPNELGLYDMSGNVLEWCRDGFASYDSAPQTNPTGPASASSCVLRGGSFLGKATLCRVSNRINCTPAGRGNGIGLRLAL